MSEIYYTLGIHNSDRGNKIFLAAKILKCDGNNFYFHITRDAYHHLKANTLGYSALDFIKLETPIKCLVPTI